MRAEAAEAEAEALRAASHELRGPQRRAVDPAAGVDDVQARLAAAEAEAADLRSGVAQLTAAAEADALRARLGAADTDLAALRAQVEELKVANAELSLGRDELVAQRARKYRSLPVPGTAPAAAPPPPAAPPAP